jgi:hypothetical protein
LNKACKKDDFPLERVDKIVDDKRAQSSMYSWCAPFASILQIILLHKRFVEADGFTFSGAGVKSALNCRF